MPGTITHFKKIILLAWLLCPVFFAAAQYPRSASAGISAARLLYHQKNFKRSANEFFNCFAQDESDRTDDNLFVAAEACARAGYRDSAFKFLAILIKKRDDKFYDRIMDSNPFGKLRHDKRWPSLIEAIFNQEDSPVNVVSKELVDLKTVRVALDKKKALLEKKYGRNTRRLMAWQDSVAMLDSLNCAKLKSIIHTYGWLGYDRVDSVTVRSEIYLYQKGNILFQKRYYALIAAAFRNRGIDAYDYAVITDRISIYDTGKQIFGTQMRTSGQGGNEPFPIENQDSVTLRRRQIGLEATD